MLANFRQCTILLRRLASCYQRLPCSVEVAVGQLCSNNITSCHVSASRRFSNNIAKRNTGPANSNGLASRAIVVDADPGHEGETDPLEEKGRMKKYNIGKRWLAKMMGDDIGTYGTDDVNEAISYLLPSHLFLKNCRPTLGNPLDLNQRPKKGKFDQSGRPIKAGFYTGKPMYHDLIFEIWSLLEILDNPGRTNNDDGFFDKDTYSKFVNGSYQLPVDKPKRRAGRQRWIGYRQLCEMLGERITKKHQKTIICRLIKLAKHPRKKEILGFLKQYQSEFTPKLKNYGLDVDVIDGTARAMGYRKKALADVLVREGSGLVTINNKSILDHFPCANDREQLMLPLLVVDGLDQFDIEAHVMGGGPSGESGAIRLGISLSIAALCPQHHMALKEAKLLMRDPRRKERKKPGRKKARRKRQWVKR